MPQPIMDIAAQYQKDAQLIRVVRKELTVKNIEQYYFEVRPKSKEEVLSRLLDIYNPHLSIVFCNTKKQVDELVTGLQGRGYFAEGLHGDMKQQQRDRVMNGFRNGRTDILVATDVAARALMWMTWILYLIMICPRMRNIMSTGLEEPGGQAAWDWPFPLS